MVFVSLRSSVGLFKIFIRSFIHFPFVSERFFHAWVFVPFFINIFIFKAADLLGNITGLEPSSYFIHGSLWICSSVSLFIFIYFRVVLPCVCFFSFLLHFYLRSCITRGYRSLVEWVTGLELRSFFIHRSLCLRPSVSFFIYHFIHLFSSGSSMCVFLSFTSLFMYLFSFLLVICLNSCKTGGFESVLK